MRIAIVVAAAWGCGSSGSGGHAPGTVSGVINGQTFAIHSAASISSTTEAIIVLESTQDVCADAAALIKRANRQQLTFTIAVDVGPTSMPPTTTGAFPILAPSGPSASLIVDTTDSTCQEHSPWPVGATSGTVTLTAITGDYYAGKYDVTLESGDHITGSFDPEACPALNTPGTQTCMP